MSVATLLRQAREAASLTQSDLATAARTAQSAIAAYESGRRTPTVPTLRRLLECCGQELVLTARPQVRRGAAALSDLAPQISEDLEGRRERDAVRLLYGFADDFRGSSRAGKAELIGVEPPPTGDPRFDAALAGVAELFAREAELPAPAWVEGSSRFVEPWWFVSSRRAFDAYTLAHTPAALARHGVFIAREAFDRA